MLETEDVLIDWKEPMYLNFTHIDIMNRLDSFYQNYGVMERLLGDIYVCQEAAAQRQRQQSKRQDDEEEEEENRDGVEEQRQQQQLLQSIELDRYNFK